MEENNSQTAAKGTQENPYSVDEFMELSDNGQWSGGYVAGLGYVTDIFNNVIVLGNSYEPFSYSYTSQGYGFYSGVGIQLRLKGYATGARIGTVFTTNAFFQKTTNPLTYTATTNVYVDNVLVQSIQMHPDEGNSVYSADLTYLGSANVNLNLYTGHVVIKVVLYGEINENGLGHYNDTWTQVVYDEHR